MGLIGSQPCIRHSLSSPTYKADSWIRPSNLKLEHASSIIIVLLEQGELDTKDHGCIGKQQEDVSVYKNNWAKICV